MFIKIKAFLILKFNYSETLFFFISVFRSCLSISKRMHYDFFVLKEITKFNNNKIFIRSALRLNKAFVAYKLMNSFLAWFYFFLCEL